MTTDTDSSPSHPPPTRRFPVRVIIIDADRVVRDAIADLIELDPAVAVVGETGTLAHAQALLSGLKPDVVILDPRLPDGDGLEICRHLRAADAATRCLILTADIEPEAMADAMEAGAAGYLIKDLTELDLADAVKAIAAGESRLNGRSAPVPRRADSDRSPLVSLTTMEMSIMLLLAEGLTNRQIANRLFFSESTIRDYIARLSRKLGVDDRARKTVHATHSPQSEPTGPRPVGARRRPAPRADRAMGSETNPAAPSLAADYPLHRGAL